MTYTIDNTPFVYKIKGTSKCIKIVYSNKKGIQRFIKFYPTIFLAAGNDDKTTSVYNTIHNIITRFGVVIDEDKEEAYFCHNCGAKLKNKKAKHCTKCGAKQ